ncbi:MULTISPECIES: hypothetical protein [Enterobacteriaceae]|uniref:hypothetical protein n=1 Tax=Enterobacteriaceae TaxID=543 RepID=UPI00397508EF
MLNDTLFSNGISYRDTSTMCITSSDTNNFLLEKHELLCIVGEGLHRKNKYCSFPRCVFYKQKNDLMLTSNTR